jgi:8-oxo-dGTP pyrophosphatase MutT (NUDIX family)
MVDTTLTYIFKDNQVLLAMKKRGYGVGKLCGPGGKLHDGEAHLQAAIRETEEEIGVTPDIQEPIGHILFHDIELGSWTCTVYRTEKFIGDPVESEEMKPQWFDVAEIPYDSMWSGDDKWMPHVVNGQRFTAEMWYDGEQHNTQADIQLLPKQ